MTRVALLVNPAAGGGRAARHIPAIVSGLTRPGIELQELRGRDARHALELASAAVRDGVDVLVAAGGDGSVNLAVQAIGDSPVALGIVPLGTGNDNARSFGVPRGDLAAAVETIATGGIRLVDVAVVTTADGVTHRFTGVLSSGFDSQVNERANRMSFPRGRVKYLAAIIAQLATFHPTEYRVTLGPDGEVVDDLGMLVAVGNGPQYGGGMRVCPSAAVDDGMLYVTFLHRVGIPTFLRVLPTVFSGKHVNHPSVSTHCGRTVRIEATGQLAYADGERIGDLPVEISVLPSSLRVLVPADAGR